MAFLLFMLHLSVRQGRLTLRAPVDDPGAFVNIAFPVQADKHFLYGFGAALIHRETFPVPVAGNAQLLQLVLDGSGIFLFPLPGPLQETFASQFFLINALFFELICHLYFRGDGRMVRSRNPQGIVSFHPLIADQDVLQRIIKGMPHVELSCDIRRRHNRRKRLPAPVNLGMEIFILTPFFIQLLFDRFRIVCLCQFLAHLALLLLAFFTLPRQWFTVSSQLHKETPFTKCKGRNFRGTTLIYVS